MESRKWKVNNLTGWGFNPTKTFALLLALFMTVISVQAQTITANQVKTDVAKLFENNYKTYVDGDVEVKITGCQFAELQLPDGKITYKIASGSDRILPRDIKRVDVYVNGVYTRTLNLPAQTVVYKDVLVASDLINREQTLTKECTAIKRVDVSMKANYVLDESMLDKEITTKKMFQKGEIIDKRFVKMKPDVARNSDVRVFFVSKGAVMITIDGTAMGDGMVGDYINVENRNYKKIYNGKIIGENRVLVNI
ncbi:flagellar basal body P-ring formation protein FlgA [bacterium]|nr:flagellar basal body P-ring formation protein FlgA [bacterium]